VSSAIRDITERKTVEERFRGLLESAPDAMLIVNRAGTIVLVNSQAEALFGYARDELLGQKVEVLAPERFRSRHPAYRSGYFSAPRPRPMSAELALCGLRKDGTEFPVEISLNPIETEDGLLVSSSIRDITDRKRFDHALSENNVALAKVAEARNTFLATMSHELRTPMNAIIGFTGVLLMKLSGPLTPDQEKQLNTMQSSARRLLSLMNDFLDLIKLESGKGGLNFEPLSCASVIADMATTLRPVAENKGLTFQVTLPEDDIVIYSDRRTFSQIVNNLVTNAIKFTVQGGIGVVLARREENGRMFAAISIDDSGCGIKPEDQAKLFAAFPALDSLSGGRKEGTGLRLHLSQKLAEVLGGRITLKSEYGKGSTFSLLLPEK